MIKGFVTIATGDDRYYKMARNLLRSYRQTSNKPFPFALISDRTNEITQEFDNVVIIDNPNCSWMDKLSLVDLCPYDENIFIDADCIIYNDINYLWDIYSTASDFSCFGKALPLDSDKGWFSKDAINIYPIHFITHLHGIMYFLRKGEILDKLSLLIPQLHENYDNVPYKGFDGNPADEPIYAMAMAIMNLKPVERKPHYYAFVPYATKISTDYYNKRVVYDNPTDGLVKECDIVHWGNMNTKTPYYRFDVNVINSFQKNRNVIYSSILWKIWFSLRLPFLLYWIQDCFNRLFEYINWFICRVKKKLKKEQ